MAQFVYRIQPARPAMLVDGPNERESETIGRHFEYLKELTAAGRVLMAGRTLNTDDSSFGIVVFVADTKADAEALVGGDPAVAQGVMRAELFPFGVALWAAGGPGGGGGG